MSIGGSCSSADRETPKRREEEGRGKQSLFVAFVGDRSSDRGLPRPSRSREPEDLLWNIVLIAMPNPAHHIPLNRGPRLWVTLGRVRTSFRGIVEGPVCYALQQSCEGEALKKRTFELSHD